MQQQFQVPQFIDIEGKILGPFTLRQTAILGIGAVAIFLLRLVLEQFLWIPVSIFVALTTLALALIKINNMPLLKFLGSFAGYVLLPRLYIWRKAGIKKNEGTFEEKKKKKGTEGKTVAPTPESVKERLRSYAEKQN